MGFRDFWCQARTRKRSIFHVSSFKQKNVGNKPYSVGVSHYHSSKNSKIMLIKKLHKIKHTYDGLILNIQYIFIGS